MKYILILLSISLVSLMLFVVTSRYKRTLKTEIPSPAPSLPPRPIYSENLFQSRDNFASMLQSLNFTTGAELGVQNGLYSEHILRNWPSCTTFYLIDIWKPQENYFDGANVPQHLQDRAYENTLKRLSPFKNKTKVLRMLTTDAAKFIPDDSLDFIYIDARHDYCGVMEDLENYYSKLKVNGILAGHDYKTAAEVRLIDRSQKWEICANGTINGGAVKGAVDDFRRIRNITSKLYITNELWASWLFFKI
jgi:hypothetical protein